MNRKAILSGILLATVLIWASSGLRAHQTVVSPYTFHQDVRPILERRCLPCHADGGIAPFALTQFDETRMRTWPIRQALTSGRMPPWAGESGRAALEEPAQALTARELDVLMTWAAGGSPEGKAPPGASRPPGTAAPPAPDLTIAMPQPYTLAADKPSADVEVVLPSAAVQGKWIRAVDLLPGTPAIVRRATVLTRSGDREQVIALWTPGDRPQTLAGGAAFAVTGDASLILRLHYQHPQPEPAGAVADQSRLAVYLSSDREPRAVETIAIGPHGATLPGMVRAIALRPGDGSVDEATNVTIVSPAGVRTRLMTALFRPEWPHRYAFVTPVTLERGSRIETNAAPSDATFWLLPPTSTTKMTSGDEKNLAALEIIP